MIPDCQSCGACCTGRETEVGIAPLTNDDAARLPAPYGQHVINKARPAGVLVLGPSALRLRAEGGRCVALLGVVGGSVSCDVYQSRPAACSAFIAGGERCLGRRQDAGMGGDCV